MNITLSSTRMTSETFAIRQCIHWQELQMRRKSYARIRLLENIRDNFKLKIEIMIIIFSTPRFHNKKKILKYSRTCVNPQPLTIDATPASTNCLLSEICLTKLLN